MLDSKFSSELTFDEKHSDVVVYGFTARDPLLGHPGIEISKRNCC